MIKQLEPYLTHIGNCGAMGCEPLDERCVCGLRQIYHKLTELTTKMIAITRYIQRIGSGSQIFDETDFKSAKRLAEDI